MTRNTARPTVMARLTEFASVATLPARVNSRPHRSPALLAASTPPENAVGWSGVIGMESTITGDGRLIEENALRWGADPLPLRWVAEDTGGHQGAVVVGSITRIWRDGAYIRAEGFIDLGSSAGREAARQMEMGLTRGVSMDLDDVSFEVRVARELIEEQAAMMEALFEPDKDTDEDTDDEDDDEDTDEEGGPAEDEEGRVTVATINSDDEVMVTTDARIRAATLVSIPAFIEAELTLDGAAPVAEEEDENVDDDDEVPEDDDAALVAGGFPVSPPEEWFRDPGLHEPTPLTVTDDGRVFGHIATWGTCHTAFTGQCVTPPTSDTNYAYFRTGSVLTAEGTEVATGAITLDTLHAGKSLTAAETLAHYEDTGRGVVDVAAGEDAHGIWVAGSLRPGVTAAQVRALRASPISGDWRRIGGNLELVAALAVNVPGFPIPRPQGLVASGVVTSLVASGMLAPQRVIAPGTPGSLSSDDLRYLKRLAERERQHQHSLDDRAAQMARRVKAVELSRRVRSLSGRP